jgi:hypothetical protein
MSDLSAHGAVPPPVLSPPPQPSPASGRGSKAGFRLFRRGPWENLATIVIAAGVIMLMQPFSIDLYGWSFLTTLVGTAMFIIVSKFPD